MGWLWRGDPWSWIVLFLFAALASLVLAQPMGRLFRRLASQWNDVEVDDGYRRPVPVTQMSTGYWWNGYSYQRSRRDAARNERSRRWFSDPAYLRDVRWLAIAAVAVAPPCALPEITLAGAVIAFTNPSAIAAVVGTLLVLVAVGSALSAWRIVGPVSSRWLRLSGRAAMAERIRKLEAQRADATTARAADIRRGTCPLGRPGMRGFD